MTYTPYNIQPAQAYTYCTLLIQVSTVTLLTQVHQQVTTVITPVNGQAKDWKNTSQAGYS